MKDDLLSNFIKIVEQEYLLDKYRWELEQETRQTKHFVLYRVSNHQILSLIHFVYSLLYVFIPLCLPLYFIFSFFKKIVYKVLISRSPGKRQVEGANILLNYSCHSSRLYLDVFNENPDLTISPSWQSSEQDIKVDDILSVVDYFKIMLNSIKLLIPLTFKLPPYQYIYLNLLPSVLECSSMLSTLPPQSNIYFCNHYDRWALLFSLEPRVKKHLIQHGAVSEIVPIAHQIKDIAVAYALNQASQHVFMNHILTGPDTEFKHYEQKNHIERVSNKAKQFLLINQPNTTNKDIEITNMIIEKVNADQVDVMLKMHPLVKNPGKKLNKNVLVCTKTIPSATLVFAYDSTLGNEYEKQGYKVVWIKKSDSVENIVNQAFRLL